VPDFVKYQALGNDYLVVDPRETDLPCAPGAVRLLCDRNFGVGADGVLHGPIGPVGAAGEPAGPSPVGPSPVGPSPVGAAGEPVHVQTVNSDGSACARSANGVRMFALYLAERQHGADRIVVRTAGGDSVVHVRDAAAGLVSVELGAAVVRRRPERITAGGRRFELVTVDNGNPHAVVFCNAVSADLARGYGEAIAGHERFPGRTNVQFAEVVDERTVRIEVYERGAGYTLASGASACAVASAARALGLTGAAVTVRMPGGAVEVAVGPDGAVSLCGPVEQVASGRVSPALRRKLKAAR